MLLFFMLGVYTAVNVYILSKFRKWLTVFCKKRSRFFINIMTVLYICMSAAPGLCLISAGNNAGFYIHRLSNFWLVFGFMLVFMMLVLELIKIAGRTLTKKEKEQSIFWSNRWFAASGIVIIAVSVLVVFLGYGQARIVRDTPYEIQLNKTVEGIEEYKIAFVADLHLGYSTDEYVIKQMVDKVNKFEPDIILIGGDIFDSDYDAIRRPEKVSQMLSQMKSRCGVYGVYGNHDVSETLVGGFSTTPKEEAFRDRRMEQFLKDSGIEMLEDETITVCGDKIVLVGRLDGLKAGDGTGDRLNASQLMSGMDKGMPVIVLEHEPTELNALAEGGADIVLAGHTHAGQFFPITVAQKFIWEDPYGMIKTGNSYDIVTSGIGTYGPPIRTMTKSEVVEVTVKFNNKQGKGGIIG